MWPFSDSDINKAEEAIAEELERRYGRRLPKDGLKNFTIAFLRGFEIKWKEYQSLPDRYEEFVRKDPTMISKPFESEIDARIKDECSKYKEYLTMSELNSNAIFNFGQIAGFFMALFRFHPLAILGSQTETIITSVNFLHDKPHIHKMVKDAIHHFVLNKINGMTDGHVDRLGEDKYRKYRLVTKEIFGY